MDNTQLIKNLDNRAIRMQLRGINIAKPVSEEIKPHDFLIANGFFYAGYCACSGVPNYKYSKNHYLVYLLPKRKTFHLKYINNYIIKNQPITSLCKELNRHDLLKSEDSLQVAK